jgi:hypothetical protein
MYCISRKITFLFASAIILGLVVGSGCKEDNGVEPQNNESNESLEGSWRLTTVTLKDTPVGDMTLPAAQFLEMSGTGATTSTMQFTEDGSAAVTTTYEDADDEVIPGTWRKESDKLVIEGAGIDQTVPYAIDGSTLTLTIILPIDFDSDGTADDTDVDMIYTKL